jgi:sterol desaturase/sphingolipid hydroxylase (fatty acid hydroxylase superfamily)
VPDAFNDEIRANVDLLEQRARDAAQQEMDRSQTLDQKTAGLIAAALVLLAAGVAFASQINGVHVGGGARTLWAVIVVVTLILLLTSLVVATAAITPQAYRVVIHINVLDRWPTSRHLDRDPTRVRGELMQASIGAVRAARPINKKKADRLGVAFGFFAAAIVSIVILGSAVAIRLAESPEHHVPRRRQPAAKRVGT